MIIIRIGRGRSKSGKILDGSTTWFNLKTIEDWERCVREWSLKKNSGKPIFMSCNGRAYKEISGTKLLQLKDKL
jgi:hypothetical protein